ncbi:MAG: tetratricopeptide repeat protein [Planctomycetota bacterium]
MTRILAPAVLLLCLFAPVCTGRSNGLANEGSRGLQARSIEQVLRLRPEEVDLATAALIASEQWSDMVRGRSYLGRLDDMALEIREMLEAGRLATNYEAIPVINEYLFEKQAFRSMPEVTDPNELFLHVIMDKKQGYCLSLSILYLSLAERLGVPVYGVVVPGHFFVRYDDGQESFNIETTSNGGTADDEHYINKFKVPAYRDSIYMKSLDKIQTLGCFFNNLGNSYSSVGDIHTAQAVLEKSVEINPSLAESHMNLGNIYLKKERLSDAINEYRTALEINPDDAKGHLNLGNAYTEQGWLTQAIAEYNISLRLDSNIVDTYINLATVYCKQNMFSSALSQIRQALNLEPKNSLLYSQLGDVYSKMGDYDTAMLQYKKALKMKPRLAQAHYGMALCYNKLALSDDEIAAYKRALAIEPDMVAALVNLGNAYFAKQIYDDAIEQYERAIRKKPNDATIYYNLGAAHSNKGDYEQAVTAHEKAAELDPEMGDAHNGLAYSYFWLKKYDLAWKHIKTAERLGVAIDKKLLVGIKRKMR